VPILPLRGIGIPENAQAPLELKAPFARKPQAAFISIFLLRIYKDKKK
jgi:hypothetical protein